KPHGARGHVVRLEEKLITLVGQVLPGSWKIHHRIDDDECDMDAARPEAARHGLRQAALGGLGRRESRSPGSSSSRRCGADEDEVACLRRLHRRYHLAADSECSKSIHAPCSLEVIESDALYIAPHARVC